MKKIMFNDRYGLTKFVLDGTKTQTRRIVPKEFFTLQWDILEDTLVFENQDGDFIDIRNSKYPLCKVGEIVAVAQCYKDLYSEDCERAKIGEYIRNVPIKNVCDCAGWTNKMFVRADLMPHQIRITNVRIERLQDISDEDCIKEGIFNLPKNDIIAPSIKPYAFYDNKKRWYCDFDTPREAYAALIDKVSGKGTWDSNPWVFCYEFELIK